VSKKKKVYYCVCHDCDYKVKKEKDVPCKRVQCLDCGKPMSTKFMVEED
jgi:hypothetical protein